MAGATTRTGGATTTALLADLRRQRGFDAGEVLAAKVGRIDGWSTAQGLDAVVVGVSGGVDSAVVLGLLSRVPALRRVVALLLPIEGPGATAQAEATRRGRLVATAFGVEAWECPLGEAHAATMAALAEASGLALDDWAAGQLLSAERTPALYGAAALLQAHGHRSLVVGTTNRDEGAYLGFFGKASDAMVDLQPISDLHKSEVVALARRLGVPTEVLEAEPSGDVWDGRSDAEMIGAGYDDVELVLRLRELGRDPVAVATTLADGGRLAAAAGAVEALHAHNAHKYAVGSPAVHLDVLPRGVAGGWADESLSGRDERPPTGVPAPWDGPEIELAPVATLPEVADLGRATLAHGVLSPEECDRLVAAFAGASTQPVDVSGRPDASTGVGSHRATAFAPALAADLWRRIGPAVASVRFVGPFDPTDAWDDGTRSAHRSWRVVGLSPVLRFMRYDPGGCHRCHYDAAYDYGDGRRTLTSVVLYLTGDGSGAAGGATRLVADGQDHLPVQVRDHRDWDRDVRPDEVLLTVPPRAGDALCFDHRRGHDVERWDGPGPRVVIRADVVYEVVPDGRGPEDEADPVASDLSGKLARDPFLGPVAARWGEQAADDAGFFVDTDALDAPLDDVGWLCTPTAAVHQAVAAGDLAERRPIVLLATGAFFPLHRGHVEMMRLARARAEAAGWWVVGGYLSPGHDEYLRLKWGRDAAPASTRLRDLAEMIGAHQWLAVDPWEAQHRRVAVNSTDVTARLQAYLRHHAHPDVDVAFVCGADNARFALAFALEGRCIVVGRPGADDEVDRWRSDPRLAANARLLWADGGHGGASSALRPGPSDAAPHRLTVRIEDHGSVRSLRLDSDRWTAFQRDLCCELARHTDVRTVEVADQRLGVEAGMLSLDPLLPGAANLAVSRRFDLGGYSQLGHAARPGHPPLDQQVATIGPGPWVVRDDDRATGGTVEFVRGLVEVESVATALPPTAGEIADSRDFLLGADDGGLVVALPDGSLGRAPYLLPYVDPAARGAVPAGAEHPFSAAVWRLNAQTFAGTGCTVGDLPDPARRVVIAAGHDITDSLDAVCLWHADVLDGLAPPVTEPVAGHRT